MSRIAIDHYWPSSYPEIHNIKTLLVKQEKIPTTLFKVNYYLKVYNAYFMLTSFVGLEVILVIGQIFPLQTKSGKRLVVPFLETVHLKLFL